MIRRMQNNYSSVGVIIDEEELDSISFCSTCAANGIMSKLKNRIYLDNKGKRTHQIQKILECAGNVA